MYINAFLLFLEIISSLAYVEPHHCHTVWNKFMESEAGSFVHDATNKNAIWHVTIILNMICTYGFGSES